MALRELSIGLGIAAGTAGVANSGYGLYERLVAQPVANREHNEALLGQTPLVAESVEIRPDPGLDMRIEVTVKIYPSGDILVESGARRQFIPFGLTANQATLATVLRSAAAAETAVVGGVTYEVETLRYVEETATLASGNLRRTRTFSDGTVETSVIDVRSNAVLETHTGKRALTPAERQAIEASPYRKKIFKAVR